ncbi:hypothetical protein V8D89_007459 [Ganoderma adspersum]
MDFLHKYDSNESDTWFPSNFVRLPAFRPVHSIGVVNLARLMNQLGMLPTMLMDCFMLCAEIVDGPVREDRAREVLAQDDLGRCFVGRTKMAQASASRTRCSARPSSRRAKHMKYSQRVLQPLLNVLVHARDEVLEGERPKRL